MEWAWAPCSLFLSVGYLVFLAEGSWGVGVGSALTLCYILKV